MIALLAAGGLFALAPSPGFSPAIPKTLGFEFARLADPENNARVWWSSNQAFGWVSLRLGEAGADRKWPGRLGQFLGLAYLNLAVGHYTHELGHERDRSGWSIDPAAWGSPWPWPRFVHGHFPAGLIRGPDDRLALAAAGLNQEEYDAYHAFKSSPGSMSFDESMAFSFRKLSGVTYDLYTGRAFGYHRPGEVGDIERYTSLLRAKGIAMTGAGFAMQAALSDLLTFRLWEAWAGNWRYLRYGEREKENFAWRAGDWTVLPPLVNGYLTPRGVFYDVALFSHPPGPGSLETRFGWDADFLGSGKVDRMRLGGGYALEIPLAKTVRARLAPSGFATLRRSGFGPAGWIAALETGLRLYDRAGIGLRLEYGRDDLVEHVAKGKEEGLLLTLGTELRI